MGTERLTRSHGKLLAGIALAVAAPTALFVYARAHAPAPPPPREAVSLLPRGESRAIELWDAKQMVRHPDQPAEEQSPARAPAPEANPDPSEPEPSAEPAADAVMPALVVASAEPAFEVLRIVDPMLNAVVEPVALTSLPEAVTTAAAVVDVPVYEPGSVGKAKRQWAGGSTGGSGGAAAVPGWGALSGADGIGGHCPMPGGHRPHGGKDGGRGAIPPRWTGPIAR